jgi:phosphoribosyl-ATP pyrophosphohydrolase
VSTDVLVRLAATIHGRRAAGAGTSYTRQLLDAGPEACARKFGEEALEAVIAGVGPDPAALRSEAADVLYHLIVLLEARGVLFSDVLVTLEAREKASGLQEKAQRKRPG